MNNITGNFTWIVLYQRSVMVSIGDYRHHKTMI